MCGIVFVHQNKELGRASKRAWKMYLDQKTRGTQGYGCVVADKNKVNKVYRAQYEAGMETIKRDHGNMVLFHHRTPTSTPNLEECTHPIFVSHDSLEFDYYIIHNGVISNAEKLKKKYEEMGFVYTTEVTTTRSYKIGKKRYEDHEEVEFNDTESLAIDLALAIENGSDKLESEGSIAFIGLQVDKRTGDIQYVFFGRNYKNPLKMTWNTQELVLSSVGDSKDVEPHTLYAYDPLTKEISQSDLGIDRFVYTPPVNSTPPRTLFEGRGNMGFVNTNTVSKKRNKQKIVESSIRLTLQAGISELVEFKTQGDYLYKTAILFCDVDKIEIGEWKWYKNILSGIDGCVAQIKKLNKHSDSKYKDHLVKVIKDRVQELTVFSNTINMRKATVAEGREVIIRD